MDELRYAHIWRMSFLCGSGEPGHAAAGVLYCHEITQCTTARLGGRPAYKATVECMIEMVAHHRQSTSSKRLHASLNFGFSYPSKDISIKPAYLRYD